MLAHLLGMRAVPDGMSGQGATSEVGGALEVRHTACAEAESENMVEELRKGSQQWTGQGVAQLGRSRQDKEEWLEGRCPQIHRAMLPLC